MAIITVTYQSRVKTVNAEKGENLLELMRREDIFIPAYCGGKGICHKCLFRVDNGDIEIQGESPLACRAYVTGDCAVTVLAGEKDFAVSTVYAGAETVSGGGLSNNTAFAVDIGTTTLVVSLIDLDTGKTAGVFAEVSEQRKYGADVVSRIEKCSEHLEEMGGCVRRQILRGIKKLAEEWNVNSGSVKKVAVVGNTVMTGIFLGEDCTSLGYSPFEIPPLVKSGASLPFPQIFGADFLTCDVNVLPSISPFIGADALAAMLFCRAAGLDGVSLIVDIGTNGELLLMHGDKVFCASAAAGPALEGGNISCGMGGASGAVCSVIMEDGKFLYKTIANKPPAGICGSGAIDLTAELLTNGLLDESGLLSDDYFDDGVYVCENVTFMQKDIRQIQLAKSALRSGIDCLIEAAGIMTGDITRVFLAGGFTLSANSENLFKIGLLPDALRGKTTVIGNAALGGAVKWLTDEAAFDNCREITEKAKEIRLAEDKKFMERFVENMMF